MFLYPAQAQALEITIYILTGFVFYTCTQLFIYTGMLRFAVYKA